MSNNEFTFEQQQAAENLSRIYQLLEHSKSNIVAQLYQEFEPGSEVRQWDHLPKDEVVDKVHRTQYYYHTHAPSDNDERLPEHGHFHIFLRKARFKDEEPIYCSQKYIESNGEKDALIHLCGIAMNDYGFPTALFTVNHWVAKGLWYNADRIIPELDTFKVEINNSPYHLVNQWMTAMIAVFKPYIVDLLHLRDEIVAEFANQNPNLSIYENQELEITSIMRLQAN